MAERAEPVLAGIKVLDLSRVLAGPWCTMTLADLGADVWKIEHPRGGDDTRTWSPPEARGIATYYLAANRSKRSLALDLSSPAGRDIVLALAREADIVVENFRPDSFARLGLDYETVLSQHNPRLIHCRITGYGATGEDAGRPGYDFVVQAEAGLMEITGPPSGDPARFGVAVVDLSAGMIAVQGILAALYARERTGRGQSIDVALFDVGVAMLANIGSGYLNAGSPAGRFGSAHPTVVPYQAFVAGDGLPFALAVGNDAQFRRLCNDVLLRPDLAGDSRFVTNAGRAEHRSVLVPELERCFAQESLGTWLEAFRQAEIPAGNVRKVPQVFASPEVARRALVMETPHPTLGSVRTVRSPLQFSDAPLAAATSPPLLGEHTRELLRDVLHYAPPAIDALERAGVIFQAPLPAQAAEPASTLPRFR